MRINRLLLCLGSVSFFLLGCENSVGGDTDPLKMWAWKTGLPEGEKGEAKSSFDTARKYRGHDWVIAVGEVIRESHRFRSREAF